MCCILCLMNCLDHILIYSADGITLNILHIIRKYIELKTLNISNELSYICTDCWKSLLTFHEFILRIEYAHNLLTNIEGKCFPSDNEQIKEITIVKIKEETCIESKLSPENEIKISEETCEIPSDVNSQELVLSANPENDNQTIDISDCTIKCEVILEGEEESCNPKNTRNINLRSGRRSLKQTEIKKVKKKKSLNNTKEKKTKNSSKKHSQKLDKINIDEFIASNIALCCSICNLNLLNFAQLRSHYQNEHNVKGFVNCCGKQFYKRCLLADHLYTHINPDRYKCEKCEKVFACKRSLELHIKLYEGNRERIYQCNVCSKSYFSLPVYTRHLTLHVPHEQRTVHCPQCNKLFATEYMMSQHLNSVHLKLHVQMCEQCGKSIKGRGALRAHMEMHSGQRTLFECEQCGMKLTSKYGLIRHLKVKHSKENQTETTCEICFKVSPSVSAHEQHIKYMHKTERKHACHLCDKAFKRAFTLKEHMTTHFGGALYTCTHCPKTFNSKANMYAHRKKIHRKEWELLNSNKYSSIDGETNKLIT